MKRVLLLCLLSLPAWATDTVLVAVGTTPTPMPATKAIQRTSVLVENNGSADIWCMYGAPGSQDAPTFIVGQGHRIPAGGWRPFPGNTIWCLAAVAQAGCSSMSTDCSAVSEAP